MSTESTTTTSTTTTATANPNETDILLYLDAAAIAEPEATNVRPFSARLGDTEEEIKAIGGLAATIEAEGPIQSVKVRPTSDGQYELVAGRRRKKAIELINAGRAAGNELRIKAIVSSVNLTDPAA